MNKYQGAIPLLGILAFVLGCSDSDKDDKSYISLKGGNISLTAAGAQINDYSNFWGSAQLEVMRDSSSVEVYVQGLKESTKYAAHVHNGTCADGGGGHYIQNDSGDNAVDDVAENGLWPTIDVDENGVGIGFASNRFVVRDDARSVVIHEPDADKTRIACVDLASSEGYGGEFSMTADGRDLYNSEITGKAWVSIRDAGGDTVQSKAEVYALGLWSDSEYKTHLHAADCASGGGKHYYQNDTGNDEVDDVAENGLWPFINVNGLGYGAGWASIAALVRFESANSVVVHHVEGGIKIACADLTDRFIAFRSGAVNPTDDGEQGIAGRATLSVSANGQTAVSVYTSGLWPETAYNIHVHNGSCESGGGSHYIQNYSGDLQADDVATNGLWPYITTDVDGAGKATITQNFVVRPDARSIVIHDSEDSSIRIACADLL